MEKDILEKIKKEFLDMEKIAGDDYSEIEELEKDPKVQRYLYLKGLVNLRNQIKDGESCIIDRIIKEYGTNSIKETNNILCFLNETPAGSLVYVDLEDSVKFYVINKEEKKEFERTHNVVYGDKSYYDCLYRYYKIRYQFFKDCIYEGQEAAVRKVSS